MTERETELGLSSRDGIFAGEESSSIPIHLVRALAELPDLTDWQKRLKQRTTELLTNH